MLGVTEMTLCRDVRLAHRPVIGVLFRCQDRTSCVGQFRFDMVLEVAPISPKMDLYIGMAKTATRLSYVSDVTTRVPDGQDKTQWIRIPWDGVLDWWFSNGRTIVSFRPS